MILFSKKYFEEDFVKFYYGFFNQIYNQILWNLSNRSLEIGRSIFDFYFYIFVDSFFYGGYYFFFLNSFYVFLYRVFFFCYEYVKFDFEYMYRCLLCLFGCNKIQEYKIYFEF